VDYESARLGSTAEFNRASQQAAEPDAAEEDTPQEADAVISPPTEVHSAAVATLLALDRSDSSDSSDPSSSAPSSSFFNSFFNMSFTFNI
jgi:hypothetical protein